MKSYGRHVHVPSGLGVWWTACNTARISLADCSNSRVTVRISWKIVNINNGYQVKTKAFITVTSWLRSKTCLTRLICAGLDAQDEVVFKTWSSKVSCGVWNNTRSLAEYARVRSFESINGQTQQPSESWLCPFHITGNFKLVMNKVQGQKFAEGHYYLITEKFSGKKWYVK